MIEARIVTKTCEDAALICAHAGLPGPIFVRMCHDNWCRLPHVTFLTEDDDALMEQIIAWQAAGGPVADGVRLHDRDDERLIITIDGTYEFVSNE